MKFWIYGYRIFKKNRILNGILALQIFISILLLNLTIGRYSMQMQSVTMFADLIDHQGIYYMPADIFEYEPVDQDNDILHNNLSSQADFSTLKKVNCLGSIHMLAFQPDNVDSPIDTIVYADCLIDKLPSFFKPQLWQTVKAQEDGKTIPVIILSNLFKNKVTSSRMLVRGSQWTNTPEYRMVDIKGKSHTGNLYLDFSSSGSGISCLDLFTVYNDRFKQSPLFLTRESAIQSITPYIFASLSCQMIFFEPDISEADMQYNITQLEKTGSVKTFSQLYQEGLETTRSDSSSLLSVVICFFAVSLVGIISMTVLNTLRYLPMFSVYYICGCRWRNCAWIILAYLLCMFAVVAAAALIFWPYMVIKDLLFSMQILLTGYNILATAAMLLLVVALALIPAFVALKARSPMQILRDKER